MTTNNSTDDSETLALPDVQWRLHTVMSEKGIRTSTELFRRLQRYQLGINQRQLTRIVEELPLRLNTQVLAALVCELGCECSDLLHIVPARTKKGNTTGPNASLPSAVISAKAKTQALKYPAGKDALQSDSERRITPSAILGPDVSALGVTMSPQVLASAVPKSKTPSTDA